MTTAETQPAVLRRATLGGALAAVLVAGAVAPAQALDVPPRPEVGAVQDQADLLTDGQEEQLNRLIGEKNDENEYIRAAVLSVNDTQGENIEDYSRKVATDWGVGDDGRNNGVLIVADMGERELRIEVGDGAREVLSDSDAENIMENQLEPGFKDGDYADAFTKTVTKVYDEADPQAAADRAAKGRAVATVILSIVGVVVLGVLVLVWRCRRSTRQIMDQAKREIEQYEREHPGEGISTSMRRAYLKYRLQNPKAPGLNDDPVRRTDKDGIERDVHYAPTFQSWLPLYAVSPSLYSGGVVNASSSSSGGSGGTSSFGGGGGFTRGGASGSF
ncbi:TPM domain-containing protein [Kocuria marina]|uniref:TPM domain-containing protein n=1 Tax=Kocuria marina TaxID=223184 RepID=UPI002989E9B5|nr:TPM domain-containing protein [Kocuria marina]MCT1722709.1 TPM domain-containing protein [Kocuria marina]MCT1734075.1 TPM domain-containing protein [Kocuria marina]